MSTEKVIIREATHLDISILKKFEQEVITYERPFADNLKAAPISYYDIAALIDNLNAQVLVAVVNNEVIASGYSLLKNSVPYKKPAIYGYLGFMYVDDAHRGKGINGLLIDELVKNLHQKNIFEIQLDVYADNESALKAYKKIGFKPDLIKMRLKL